MAIKLSVKEDRVTLKTGGTDNITLDAKRAERPVLINDYDDLVNKPSINGVELEGDLTTEDLHIETGVTSWNGQTGDVTYTPPAAPVQSVNGQVGDVVLSASDVGALPDNTPIPSKTSDLVNDSGFVNATQAANAAPVQSVNGATGTVVLDASDVGALPDTTKYAGSATVGGVATKTASIPYGKLDSTSTSTVMTATVPGITELKSGVCMWLTNGVITSASGFTININNLGAKPVYQSQAAATRSTTIFNVNYTALLIYNEDRVADGCWDYVYGYDTNTNTIGYQVRTNSMSLPMASKTYRYRLLFESADGAHYVPANNSTSTNATTARTVCQDPINPFGDIRYYGTTAAVDIGGRPSASYLWQEYAFNLGYSFQKSPNYVLTEWTPVYLKCAPQSDNSAIIDSTTPFVQTLPSTKDGKLYIYLGVAYSTTNIELTLNHPVYYIDANGHKRIWTGEDISI